MYRKFLTRLNMRFVIKKPIFSPN